MAKGNHCEAVLRDYDDYYDGRDPDYRAGGWSSCVIPKKTRQTERRGPRRTPGSRFFLMSPVGGTNQTSSPAYGKQVYEHHGKRDD